MFDSTLSSVFESIESSSKLWIGLPGCQQVSALQVIPVSKNCSALTLAASCTVAQILGSINAPLNMENGITLRVKEKIARFFD